MPAKSPASPTRPNCERSRFAEGAGLKVIALENGASDVNKRANLNSGGGSRADGLSHEDSFIAEGRTQKRKGAMKVDVYPQSVKVKRSVAAVWPILHIHGFASGNTRRYSITTLILDRIIACQLSVKESEGDSSPQVVDPLPRSECREDVEMRS